MANAVFGTKFTRFVETMLGIHMHVHVKEIIVLNIKNNQEILIYLADFALQKQPEDNLMVAISRVWYNGSYTMAAKPIKSLELHYAMIQFLINMYIF